jgi:sugar lactone lactonase YvrE
VYRIDPGAGTFEEIATTGGFALGMCLDAEGRVYVCDGGRLAIMRVTPGTGAVEVYCDSAEGAPLRTPNYPAFAADGTLWFSDSGTDHPDAEADGTLVQVAPGGGDGVTLDVRPFRFSNGIAVGPDGAIYVIESFEPCVSVVRDGVVTKLADLPRTCPDGLALDSEGGVLISCFQPNQILRVPPGGGAAELLVDDWGGGYLLTPTNVSFFGDELEHVAVASIGGWSIRAITLPWKGQPLHYPSISS